MKRRISLLLAVVMILGTFSFAFAADVNEKVDLVTKEGILRGDQGTNALRLDDPLARKEAVVLLSRLMDVEEEANNFEKEGLPTFADVQDAVYYKSFIAWAEDNKYFDGNPDGTFGFNDNLTVKQYAAVLLRALGYAEEVYNVEGWKNVEKLANDLNLLEDVETELNDDATREEVAVMTFNALGAKMKDSDKTLAEFLGIEMPVEKPEKLEANVLDTENLAEVVVELSNVDLVKGKDALLNPANYRLSNDAKVQHVHLDGDNVVLTLVPYGKVEDQGKFVSLIKGEKFDLTIRNIDKAINKTYRNIVAGDNAIPVVENVEFMGDYGIKVTTSEPIANPLERNFRLDSRTSMIVEQYGRDIILTPYHGKAFDKDAVELTIDKLEDFAGYTSVRTIEEMELSTDDALPKVEAAYRSGSKLVVEFDRDVYHDSVKAYANRRSLGNVSFTERRVDFYAEKAEKVDTNVVEYTFSRDIPRGVEITIEGVANHFNKAMENENIVPVEYKDDYAPVVIQSTASVSVTDDVEADLKGKEEELGKDDFKKLIDKGHKVKTKNMTIVFDKDIAQFKDVKTSDIDVDEYFTLYELDITRRGKEAAEDVTINVEAVSKDRITLSFEGIKLNNKDRDFDYILEVRNFSDLNRNRMERDYLDFQVVRQTDAFDIKSIKVTDSRYFNRDGVEIELVFNDYVNKEEASNAKNYYLDNKLAIDEAIVERDGYTVSLVIYDTTVAKLLKTNKVLEISPRVEQLEWPNSAPAHRFWDLRAEKPITDLPEASGSPITYINADGKDITTDSITLSVGANLDELKVKLAKTDADAQTLVYNKAGRLLGTEAKPDTTGVALKSGVSSVVLGEEYKVVTKSGKEEKVLVVKVADNDTTVNFAYKGGKFLVDTDTTAKEETVISADATIKLPYDIDVDKISKDEFTITAVSKTAKSVRVEKAANSLVIFVEAEDGTEKKYTVTLDNVGIDFTKSSVKFGATNDKAEAVVVDELGEKVTTLVKANFETAGGTEATEISEVVNDGEGVYTITFNAVETTGSAIAIGAGSGDPLLVKVTIS